MFQTTVNKLKKIFAYKSENSNQWEDVRFKNSQEQREFYNGVKNLKQALDNSDRFGALRARRKYGIMIYTQNNTFRWVTSVDYLDRTFKYEWDKQAMLFEDSWWCEDLVSGMLCNGFSAFIVTIPDVFREEDIRNVKEKSDEE